MFKEVTLIPQLPILYWIYLHLTIWTMLVHKIQEKLMIRSIWGRSIFLTPGDLFWTSTKDTLVWQNIRLTNWERWKRVMIFMQNKPEYWHQCHCLLVVGRQLITQWAGRYWRLLLLVTSLLWHLWCWTPSACPFELNSRWAFLHHCFTFSISLSWDLILTSISAVNLLGDPVVITPLWASVSFMC